ncbi:HisM ABC-type amino acid transport system, permease component [Burkholderiaceae bacterium]|jgi:polar amino acid transport system permease protein
MNFFEILSLLSQGIGQTLLVTLVCSATALVFALVMISIRTIGGRPSKLLVDAAVYCLRGIPVLVLLFLVYFGLPLVGLKVVPLAAMALSLGLIGGAYVTEVFRGALDSVEAVELMAAESMGMSRLQIFCYVQTPQMLRFSAPGVLNEFTSILKYSPFAYTVGIPEITKQATVLASQTLKGAEIYLAVGILYFLIYRVLLALARLVERRFQIPGVSAL